MSCYSFDPDACRLRKSIARMINELSRKNFMSTNSFDVVIIGTGAGGGALAQRLAPSGKRILILERGGFLP